MAVDEVDLGGWHIGFAMRYGDVNKRIADRLANPPKGAPAPKYETSIDISSPTKSANKVAGTVSPWRLVTGGSKSSVVLAISISDVEMSIDGASYSDGGIEVTIAGVLSTSTDGLVTVTRPAGDDSPYTLALSFEKALGIRTKADTKEVLEPWLDSLWPAFGVAITSIDYNIKPVAGGDADPWGWARPTVSRAIVSEVPGGTAADQQLVLLSMTGSKPRPPTDANITGSIIPQGADVGVAVAPRLVLEHLIRPGVKGLLKGADPDHFVLSDHAITSVKEYLESDVTFVTGEPSRDVTFTGAKVTLDGQVILFSTHLSFPYGATNEATVSFDYVCQYKLGLVRKDFKDKAGSVIQTNVPLIDGTVVAVNSAQIEVTASASIDIAAWAVPLTIMLLGALAAGYATYRATGAEPEAVEDGAGGRSPVSIKLIDMRNEEFDSADEDDVSAAAEDAENTMANRLANKAMNLIKLRWAKVIGAAIGAAIVGGAVAEIPTYIVAQLDVEGEKVGETLDGALAGLLTPADLPFPLDGDMAAHSVGVNNCLLLGAVFAPQKTQG